VFAHAVADGSTGYATYHPPHSPVALVDNGTGGGTAQTTNYGTFGLRAPLSASRGSSTKYSAKQHQKAEDIGELIHDEFRKIEEGKSRI